LERVYPHRQEIEFTSVFLASFVRPSHRFRIAVIPCNSGLA